MSASLGELFIELAFEGDTEGADKFRKKVKEVIKTIDEQTKATKKNKTGNDDDTKSVEDNTKAKDKQKHSIVGSWKALLGYVGAITGAIYSVNRLTQSLLEQNQTWLNITRTSDIALSTFQKWDEVGKAYGIKNAAQQIKSLNDRLFELKLTGANAQGFMLAGINPTNADDVMEQLRNRVSGISDTAAAYLLRQMGLDENLLHILRLSRKEFNELNAAMSKYRLTPRQRQDLQYFQIQVTIASQKLQYLKDKAIIAIFPYWIKFLKFISNAAEGLSIVVDVITKFYKQLTPTEKGILKIAAAIGVLTAAIWALTAHPIIAGLTLLIGALLLIFDDIRAYSQGYNSVIGEFLKFLDDLSDKINFDSPQWLKDLLYICEHIDNIGQAIDDVKNGKTKNGEANVDIKRTWAQNHVAGVMAPFLSFVPAPVMSSVLNRYIPHMNNNSYGGYTYNIKQENNISTNQPADVVQQQLTGIPNNIRNEYTYANRNVVRPGD